MPQSYFSHDSNARNSTKILRVRMKHGAEGYAVYFMILERLRDEEDYTSAKAYDSIAFDLRVSTSIVKSVVEDFGLFAFTEDGERFYSEGLRDRMAHKDDVSDKRRLAGQMGAQKRWKNSAENEALIANVIKNDSICHEQKWQNDSNKSKVNNNNSLSLSLSPLESSEKEEEEKSGVSAAERERFYEVFYFRNLKNPAGEVDRFVDYYEANGWCRSTGQKPVKNRISLARAWKASSDQPRVDLTALKWLEAVYAHLKAEDKDAASAIIHGGVFNLEVEPIDAMHRRIVIYCASSKVYESIESAAAAGVKAPGGYAVTYRVRKNS